MGGTSRGGYRKHLFWKPGVERQIILNPVFWELVAASFTSKGEIYRNGGRYQSIKTVVFYLSGSFNFETLFKS